MGVFSRSEALMPMTRVYFMLLSIGLITYMVRDVRRYGNIVLICYLLWRVETLSDLSYQSYSTFSLAFKQRIGQSVTAWMREMAG